MGVAAPTEAGAHAPHRLPPPPIPVVQAAFPQLQILELIGQGGMGAVYKARQPKLNRFVALKLLPEAMSRQPAFAERFAREAQMLARLNHPNIVTVHDFGQSGQFFYLLMEYVEGVNLRQAMSAGKFTPEQALAIVPMICDALQYAHEEGVLHRDVKPENILLDTKGRVRLVDFGIAKLASVNDSGSSDAEGASADAGLTRTGSALGTPNYMAPEQRSNPSTVDQRADIYSLGVVFYELLTGELPVGRFAPPSRRTPVDPRVDDVVMRAIARQKERRFAAVKDIKSSVETIVATPAVHVPRAAESCPLQFGLGISRVLILELIVLVALMTQQLFEAAPFMWRQVLSTVQGSMPQASVALTALAVIALMGFAVWRRRHWLLAPFRQPDFWEQAEASSLPGRASVRDEGLRMACLGLVGVLALQLIWLLVGQGMILAQAVADRNSLLIVGLFVPLGVVLVPALLGIVVVVMFVRRELRRTEIFPPTPPPRWAPRMAVLILALAVLTMLPVQTGDNVQVTMTFGPAISLAALAWLTMSRIWRAVALAFLFQLIAMGIIGLGMFSLMKFPSEGLESWETAGEVQSFGLALIMQIVSLGCYGAAMISLLLPEAAASFGLRRSKAEAELVTASHVIP